MAQEIRAFEGENILFDFDKYEIKPEAKVVLEKKAAWLRANPSFKVRIEGNTDERGTNVSSGVYFLKLEVGSEAAVRKVILAR